MNPWLGRSTSGRGWFPRQEACLEGEEETTIRKIWEISVKRAKSKKEKLMLRKKFKTVNNSHTVTDTVLPYSSAIEE